MTLDGAKQAVANYAGSYCQEFNELRNNLDDGCEVLQQVLVSDVPGPQVKLNVGQLEASKRKNFLDFFGIFGRIFWIFLVEIFWEETQFGTARGFQT